MSVSFNGQRVYGDSDVELAKNMRSEVRNLEFIKNTQGNQTEAKYFTSEKLPNVSEEGIRTIIDRVIDKVYTEMLEYADFEVMYMPCALLVNKDNVYVTVASTQRLKTTVTGTSFQEIESAVNSLSDELLVKYKYQINELGCISAVWVPLVLTLLIDPTDNSHRLGFMTRGAYHKKEEV